MAADQRDADEGAGIGGTGWAVGSGRGAGFQCMG